MVIRIMSVSQVLKNIWSHISVGLCACVRVRIDKRIRARTDGSSVLFMNRGRMFSGNNFILMVIGDVIGFRLSVLDF